MVRKFLNLFKKKAKLYASIDELPISNWFKVHEKGDLSQLVRVNGVVNNEQLASRWTELRNEFIDVFGVNEDYRDYLQRHMQIEVLKIDLAVSEDRSLLNIIEIKEQQIKELIEGQEKSSHRKAMVHVRRFMNGSLNETTTTVREYYDVIEVMKEENLKKDGPGE